MKRTIVIAACLLLGNTFLYAELTKAQLWAISLPGILTEVREGYRNSLNDKAMNESGRNSVLGTLSRDWGITTREELFEMLDSLENGGHEASFMEIQEILYEIAKAGDYRKAMQVILYGYQWDQVKWNRFRYVFNNWEKYQNVTLKAWDLGRSVSLCRWGYNAGFLTEGEAWKRIFHIARIIQPLYSSWEEYGYDYFMGRLFWASGSGQEESYLARTEPIYGRLLNSYWGWLDWNTDLDADEDDVPIIERYFLPPVDNDGTAQYLTNNSAMYNRYTWSAIPNPNPNVYECKVKKISGNDDYGYGMVFCFDDSDSGNISYYRFFINVNGRFAIAKRTDNSWTNDPVRWTTSSFLNTGYGVYNTLRVEKTNNGNSATFRIFINDNLAASFNDNSPLNGNKIGPVVSVNIMEMEQFPHIPVDVRFEY